MIRIQLLGPVQVEKDGETIRDFRSQKALGLLGYLCLQNQPVTRPYLVEMFWPDMTEARGRRNLSWALSQLSRHLPDCFASTRHTVQFVGSPDIWLDVQSFQESANSTSPKLLDLYQGELMAGLFLDECPEFETWLVGEREVWRQRVVQLLQGLVKECTANGRYAAAIQYTRRLLTLDPWHEASHRQLMQLLAYDGQKASALAHYEVCRTTLQEALGVDPEPETTALLERIQRGVLQAPQPPEAGSISLPRSRRSHIPAATRLFVGRQAEIKEICRQIKQPSCRLLTILGPGGIGKTRLALQVARQLESEAPASFANGIYWIPLETANSWTDLLTAVAQALQLSVPSQDVARLQDQIKHFLQNREVLLLLDNFEQLLPSNIHLLAWLQEAPRLKLLITSRVRLNLRPEWSITLSGLDVPPALATEPVESYDAIHLFLHRARQKRPFPLTAEALTAVTKICRLVEGLPLAIELAAAWTHLLSPQEIWRELAHNFDWLMSETADLPDRHRSLNAVVAYSWNLLSAPEQDALSKLSVFSGGFRREAARIVAATSLQTLAHLLDQSLIYMTAVPGRFNMHPNVRHYAAGQLSQHPFVQQETRLAHLEAYQTFLHERETMLQGERQRLALQEIIEEVDNMRTAWEQAVQEADTAVAAQFFHDTLQTVFHVYDMQSWFREGADLFQRAVQRFLDESSPAAARIVGYKLLARQGWFLFHLGQPEKARQFLQESLTHLQAVGAPADTLFSRSYLAAVLHHSGHSESAAKMARKSLRLAAELDNRYAQAIAGNILAQIAYQQKQYDQAQLHGQQSLAIEREIGNRWSMGFSLINLGNVAFAQGDYAQATAQYEESLQIRQSMNDLRGIAICLNRLGECVEAQANVAQAMKLYQQSRDIFAEINNAQGLAMVEHNLSRLETTLE